MTRKPAKKPKPKWPICHKCAVKAGGKPREWAVTACLEKCIACGKEAAISSYRDYDWPNGDKAIWD